jgi:glycine/D-amino acid oxidase-like deaminating enzyme
VPEAAIHPAAAMLSEARGLLLRGWCRAAQARDRTGGVVPAWSENARSWSMLGALLASWHRQHGETMELDFVAHGFDARALGDATQAIGEVTGNASIERWNDDPARTLAEVIATIDRAEELLATPSEI